jgi:beta-glucosidase-like glycosyl hydrolase
MGVEHRLKGVNVALGPMMNLGRLAAGGRNWEGFGADPFLAGEAAYETVLGMQSVGVGACAKHLIGKCVLTISRLFFGETEERRLAGQ